MPERTFYAVKVGDTVTRMLAGTIPMKLKVTAVTGDLIVCGAGTGVVGTPPEYDDAWTFDRHSGAEIDHALRWGPEYGVTGSFLTEVEPA